MTVYSGSDLSIPNTFSPSSDRVMTDAHKDTPLQARDDTYMAERKGPVAMSTVEKPVEDWVAGASPLSDIENVVDVAEALDKKNVIAATIISAPVGEGGVPLSDYAPQAAFDLVGFGIAMDGDQPIWFISYNFDSSEDAEASVEDLRKGWEENADQDPSAYAPVSDVTTDGSIATVVMKPGDGLSGVDLRHLYGTLEPIIVSR